MPAATATGFPLSVPAWYTGPAGASCSITSRRPPNAAQGKPPPITLPSDGEVRRHAVVRLRAAVARAGTR